MNTVVIVPQTLEISFSLEPIVGLSSAGRIGATAPPGRESSPSQVTSEVRKLASTHFWNGFTPATGNKWLAKGHYKKTCA